MHVHSLLASAVILLALASPAASADPLHYDESVQGDFGFNPVELLVLGVGTNTILGTMHGVQLGANVDSDIDGFDLRLPSGLRVADVRINMTFRDTTSNTEQFEVRWSFLPDFQSQFLACFFVVDGAPTSAFEDCDAPAAQGSIFPDLPREATRYFVTAAVGWARLAPGSSWGGYVDYQVAIDVDAVPEPVTALLLGLGLAAVGGFARRFRRA